MLKNLDRITLKMITYINYFLAFSLLALGVFISLDVFMRFVFGKPIAGAVEITMLLMPWIICLSFAYGLIRGSHVRVMILPDKLTPQMRNGLEIFTNLLGFLFSAVFIYGGWLLFWPSWEVKEKMFAALLNLPLWISKFAILLGMFLLCLRFFVDLLNSIKHYSKGEKY
jgi:C4-dicarboxylate transporter DctQ subunit